MSLDCYHMIQWQPASKGKHMHTDIWAQARTLLSQRSGNTRWSHQYSHGKCPHNDKADALEKQAAQAQPTRPRAPSPRRPLRRSGWRSCIQDCPPSRGPRCPYLPSRGPFPAGTQGGARWSDDVWPSISMRGSCHTKYLQCMPQPGKIPLRSQISAVRWALETVAASTTMTDSL